MGLPGQSSRLDCDERSQVSEPLLAIGFGRRSSFDAIRKIIHLCTEMVDLRKLGFADLTIAAQTQPCRCLEAEGWIEFEIARRSDNPIIVDVGRPETGDELRQAAQQTAAVAQCAAWRAAGLLAAVRGEVLVVG